MVIEDMSKTLFPECKKIILTTDPTLIADGVQEIDNEFLKWFIKNPSCDFIEVKEKSPNEIEKELGIYGHDIGLTENEYSEWLKNGGQLYKIIIPQEEPKQEKEEEYFKHLEKDKKEFAKEWEEIRQEFGFDKKEETLEEAEAEIRYSEEEVLTFLNAMISEIEIRKQNIISNSDKMEVHLLEGGCIAFDSSQDVIKETFEQFKKK